MKVDQCSQDVLSKMEQDKLFFTSEDEREHIESICKQWYDHMVGAREEEESSYCEVLWEKEVSVIQCVQYEQEEE